MAWNHLKWLPADFELHGNEIWNGTGHWDPLEPAELIAVYEDAIAVLNDLDIDVSYASVHKERLRKRYGGNADGNAYLLALQPNGTLVLPSTTAPAALSRDTCTASSAGM